MIRVILPAVQIDYSKVALKAALAKGAQLVADKAKALIMSASGSGPRGASLPGGVPVNRTGRLANRISITPTSSGLGMLITDFAPGALALEVGAKGGGGKKKAGRNKRNKATGKRDVVTTSRVMAARPYLSVALETEKSKIDADIKASVAKDFPMRKQS